MDLPGEKLLSKLWETLVEKGVGNLLKPWQTRREGQARADIAYYKRVLLARAEQDIADIKSGKKRLHTEGGLLLTNTLSDTDTQTARIEPTIALPTIVEVTQTTSVLNEMRSELNATKAILIAEEILENDTQPPPDRSIDEDWLFRWREYAGKISTEKLQYLWGSILAGELKAPGLYSLRTLEYLKSLSQEEAELISKLAKYVIGDFIPTSTQINGEIQDFEDLSFRDLLRLEDLRVIHNANHEIFSVTLRSNKENCFSCILMAHRKVLLLEHNDPFKSIFLRIHKLTSVGEQLIKLGDFDPDLERLESLGRFIMEDGFSAALADSKVENDQVILENTKKIESPYDSLLFGKQFGDENTL